VQGKNKIKKETRKRSAEHAAGYCHYSMCQLFISWAQLQLIQIDFKWAQAWVLDWANYELYCQSHEP
jgi:hypothetical protein